MRRGSELGTRQRWSELRWPVYDILSWTVISKKLSRNCPGLSFDKLHCLFRHFGKCRLCSILDARCLCIILSFICSPLFCDAHFTICDETVPSSSRNFCGWYCCTISQDGNVLANLMLHMLLATGKLVYSWLLPVKTTVFNKKSSGALFNAKILTKMW